MDALRDEGRLKSTAQRTPSRRKPDEADMTSTSPISVVMCTYNGGSYLGRQLRSIAAQSRLPCELVVCDDGSTDETVALLEAFAKTAPFPVRLHCNAVRLSSTRNFQQGIALAQGPLIGLCDQDDEWKPGKLQQLEELMRNASLAGVFTDADLIDCDGCPLPGSLWSRGHLPLKQQREFEDDPLRLLLKQEVATGATMVFRSQIRELYQEIPRNWFHDAWLTWMMVLYSDRVGRLKLSPERPMCYRVHTAQQTGAEAERAGYRSESPRRRLQKARGLAHVHHKARAERLQQVLQHWLLHGDQGSLTTARLREAIRFLNCRVELPAHKMPRAWQVLQMLPAYLRYGNGLAAAARDLWV